MRIRTLGGFQVEVDGTQLHFGHKAQKKPLALLKVLVALGGDNVHVEQLTDALWPESDGDQAYSAFSSTLARLRKLIGMDALVLTDGRLTLTAAFCWVDTRAFADGLEAAREAAQGGDGEAAWSFLDQSLMLYRGPFLEGEFEPPELLTARDRLHSMFLRYVEHLGEFFIGDGQLERAATLYRQGLEADELAESLFQALMRCLRSQGQLVEAIAAYQHCRQIIKSRLDSDPSPETEALHRELVVEQARSDATTFHAPEAEAKPLPDQTQQKPLSEHPSIAVLPFDTLSNDSEQMYLADGIVEDIITELSKYRWFHVIARNTTFTYRGMPMDVRRISAELAVRYVLTGSVRRLGENIRITARLVEAQSGDEIWAERYDVELKRLFELQDDIVARVAGALNPELYAAEVRHAQRRPAESIEVWNYAVRGRWHVTRLTREDNAEAQRLLEQALKMEPSHPLAMAWLAYCHFSAVFLGWSSSPPQSIQEALRLSKKALSLDENDPWVQCAMGMTEFISKQPDRAIAFYQRAIELNPNFALAHGYHAMVLAHAGEPELAVEAAQRALRLSPRDPELVHFYIALGTANFVTEDYKEAAEWAAKVIQVRPDAPSGPRLLAASMAQMGEKEAALEAVEAILNLRPSTTVAAVRATIHFKRPADRDRYMDALLKAGLPAGDPSAPSG